jgi:hypothetical protein
MNPKVTRIQLRACRLVATSAALLAAIVLTGGPAVADVAAVTKPAAKPAPGPTITWGVAPSGPDGPNGREAFTYTNVVPGTRLADWVAVVNYSDVPVTLAVYAADAVDTANGGFTLAADSEKQSGFATWVALHQPTVTVPAGKTANLPFVLSVPTDATPGDHDGGIVASLTTVRKNAKGGTVAVDDRVGARIYLRVNGPLHPALQVQDLLTSYHATANPFGGGTMTVRYTVANTGDVALAGSQHVWVSGLGATLATDTANRAADLIPGQSIHETARLSGVYAALRLTAHVRITPTVPVGTAPVTPAPAPAAVVESTTVWSIPWPLLGVIVLVLAALWGLLRLRRRRRRRVDRAVTAALEQGRREAAAAESGGVGEGGAEVKINGSGPRSTPEPRPRNHPSVPRPAARRTKSTAEPDDRT